MSRPSKSSSADRRRDGPSIERQLQRNDLGDRTVTYRLTPGRAREPLTRKQERHAALAWQAFITALRDVADRSTFEGAVRHAEAIWSRVADDSVWATRRNEIRARIAWLRRVLREGRTDWMTDDHLIVWGLELGYLIADGNWAASRGPLVRRARNAERQRRKNSLSGAHKKQDLALRDAKALWAEVEEIRRRRAVDGERPLSDSSIAAILARQQEPAVRPSSMLRRITRAKKLAT